MNTAEKIYPIETLPQNGKTFVLRDDSVRSNCLDYLSRVHDSELLQVDIKRHKSKRSLEQNRLYWAMLKTISEQVEIDGKHFTDDIWHEFYKQKFLVKDAVMIAGQVVVKHKSTTKLSVKAMNQYINEVEAHAAQELGVCW